MTKKHWKRTEKNPTAENVALDLNTFIELQTGLSIGWEFDDEDCVENRWVHLFSWHDGVKFSFTVDMTRDLADLYLLQKDLYDYCKLWNKADTREHREHKKFKEKLGW